MGFVMRARPKYEFIQPKWLRGHTLVDAGNALRRDMELSVASYDWVRSDAERRHLVQRELVELGSSILEAAIRELREDARYAHRRKSPSAPKRVAPSSPKDDLSDAIWGSVWSRQNAKPRDAGTHNSVILTHRFTRATVSTGTHGATSQIVGAASLSFDGRGRKGAVEHGRTNRR
jgi:hypothetical protein